MDADKRKLIGVRVDEETHRKMKLYVVGKGMTIQEYLMALIRQDMEKEKQKKKGYTENGKTKGKSDLQNFTILHNEFIETEILSGNEKLVFMAIKRHLGNQRKTASPSLATIAKYSRLSKRTVQRTLKELEVKGIIKIEHEQTKTKGNISNAYTVYDYKAIWTAGSHAEVKQVIQQEQEREAIELLKSIGYTVSKEKGPVSGSV